MVCGASDVLDGYIARKTKTNSQFGAVFDSISDFIFITVILIIIAPIFQWSEWMLYWIGGIAMIRFLSLTIGFIKYHTISFLHTYANKATGIVLFVFPILYSSLGIDIAVILVCSLANISAFEELLININSKNLNRNIRSMVMK